jgi:hypothetical protein
VSAWYEFARRLHRLHLAEPCHACLSQAPHARHTTASTIAARSYHRSQPRNRTAREEYSVQACTTLEGVQDWFAQDQSPGRLAAAITHVNGLRKRGGSGGHMSQSGFAQHPAVRQLLAAYSALWRQMAAGSLASSTSVLLNLGLLEERLLLQVLQAPDTKCGKAARQGAGQPDVQRRQGLA